MNTELEILDEIPQEQSYRDKDIIDKWKKVLSSNDFNQIGLFELYTVELGHKLSQLVFAYLNENKNILCLIHGASYLPGQIYFYSNPVEGKSIRINNIDKEEDNDSYIVKRVKSDDIPVLIDALYKLANESPLAPFELSDPLELVYRTLEKFIAGSKPVEFEDFISEMARKAEISLKSSESKENMSECDIEELETILYPLIEDSISTFCMNYEGDKFYSIALDCNSAYGDVLLCANTKAYLKNSDANTRWSLADWKYHGFNMDTQKWNKLWIQSAQPNAFENKVEPNTEMFMTMICRTIIKLEQSVVYDIIPKTYDFRFVSADHDETVSEGSKRIRKIRALTTQNNGN